MVSTIGLVVRSAVGGLTAVEGQTTVFVQDRFCIVCRPPYQPKTAPIEYKICDITYELQRRIDQHDNNTNTMEQMIFNIVATIGNNGNFNNTFDHCGYTIKGIYPPGGYDPLTRLND